MQTRKQDYGDLNQAKNKEILSGNKTIVHAFEIYPCDICNRDFNENDLYDVDNEVSICQDCKDAAQYADWDREKWADLERDQ